MGNESSLEDPPDSPVGIACPQKVRHTPGKKSAEVFLNVYHIAPPGVLDSLGLGLFHSGVELYGKEWSYGGTAEPVSGVFWVPPKSATPEFKESIKLGDISLSGSQVAMLLDSMRPWWMGPDYNLLTKNCNHFSEALAERLGFEVPDWVNRAARLGDLLLPDAAVEFIMEKCLQARPPPDPDLEPVYQIPDNLDALSVRELKGIMFLHSIDWAHCIEKKDMVDRIQRHQAATF
eukprot:GGOE01046716.1.p1 GENE.GGOE01046716.1~~GGOE01046716.1.p1  ORF type:complete len:233 (+),score=79.88 GGOE01046716.1:63-761(+)